MERSQLYDAYFTKVSEFEKHIKVSFQNTELYFIVKESYLETKLFFGSVAWVKNYFLRHQLP